MEEFSSTKQPLPLSAPPSTHNIFFALIFSYNSKHDAVTNAAQSKYIMELFKNWLLFLVLVPFGIIQIYVQSTTDVTLHFLSMFSQTYNIAIGNGVSVLGYSRQVVYGLNVTDKRYIFHLMETVQLTVSKDYYT